MKNLYTKTVVALLTTLSVTAYAQDIHFSQFYMSPLNLNPAAAGAFKDIYIVTHYRDQWKSVASPYKTYDLCGDMRIVKKKSKKATFGAGLTVYSDKAGDASLATTQINLNIASHIQLDDKQKLSLGLMGGYVMKSINYSALTWDNQFDGTSFNSALPSGEPNSNTKFNYFDCGAGMMWQYNKSEMYISGNDNFHVDLGVSAYHLNNPRYSFYNAQNDRLYTKYVFIGNMLYGLKNTPLSLVPGILYYRQGPAQEVKAGMMIKYTLKEDSKYTGYVKGAAISAGAFYRWGDAAVITTLLEISNYAVGISYDVNVSDLRKASNGRGGIEIVLRYVNPSNFLYQNKARFN